ncbi:MFS transporter [Candidatus Woesearchaeota archaeon]|nr:MFS transporter [Candidatus Woesearchaeota archaeon]
MALNFHRNIPLLYIYSILIKRVSMPIIILYFLLNNLNYTQIGILAAVMAVTTMITEIHGGIFADLYGKKYSLMLHSFFGMMCMFFYFIGDSFYYFVVASFMYGLAGTFITGTRNALLYDTLLQTNDTSSFKKYNGRMLLYSHLVNALVLLVIPVIYTYNVKFPFLIGIAFYIASFIVAYYFIEPPIAKTNRRFSDYNRKFVAAVKEIVFSKKALFALLMMTVVYASLYMSSEYTQPLLLISGLQVIYFGIVYTLMRALMGFGGWFTHKLEKYFSNTSLLIAGSGFIVLAFLGHWLGAGIVIIIAILLKKFFEGLTRIILEEDINKNIKSENRTTILSISSLVRNLLTALLVLSFGTLADFIGVQKIFGYAIIAFIVLILIVFFFLKRD